MTYREANTEVALVPRRVVKRDLVAGVPRTAMPEYKIWSGMLARCYNESVAAYPRYGARGIAVCDRWRDDFKNFFEDVGPRPSPKHSIDRIDNDGNYEPGNCRWATPIEQAHNKSKGDKASGFYWSDEDLEALKRMWGLFYSTAEIASVIGRTESTIRLRAFKLGLTRSASTTRLIKKNKELAHVLREKGMEAFIAAISDKQAKRKASEKSVAIKLVTERSAAIAEIMALDAPRSEKMKRLRGQGVNLSEIGRMFGLTRERVRQIEAKGWVRDKKTGVGRKINKTNPEVRSKKIDRLCRAWNKASREARLMFITVAPLFLAENLSLDAVEDACASKEAA